MSCIYIPHLNTRDESCVPYILESVTGSSGIPGYPGLTGLEMDLQFGALEASLGLSEAFDQLHMRKKLD